MLRLVHAKFQVSRLFYVGEETNLRMPWKASHEICVYLFSRHPLGYSNYNRRKCNKQWFKCIQNCACCSSFWSDSKCFGIKSYGCEANLGPPCNTTTTWISTEIWYLVWNCWGCSFCLWLIERKSKSCCGKQFETKYQLSLWGRLFCFVFILLTKPVLYMFL